MRGSREGSFSRSKNNPANPSAPAPAPATVGVSPKPRDIIYVIERCEDEFRNIYKKETSTTLGQATITRLEAGKSYRFRVYGVNSEGVEGERSESVVVHTLVELPQAPVVVLKSLNRCVVVMVIVVIVVVIFCYYYCYCCLMDAVIGGAEELEQVGCCSYY